MKNTPGIAQHAAYFGSVSDLLPAPFSLAVLRAEKRTVQKCGPKEKTMSLPNQPSKMKPLFIALGVIALIVALITQAPSIVRALSA
ncbi:MULTISPECIES: hypothetical protein [Methylocystis]|uniref:hypothetical protein n=1 Tax=Methylocystis TaxID=133 RepID=UPI0019206D5B|nr:MULTISPECIES: hypothetical protein [Methylocystis]MBL1258294.1 hypothetical protein [Methylocystis sp. Sn-Cys]